MNRRSPSLLLAAMSLVGFTSVVHAQTTITIAAPSFNDPVLGTPDTYGGATNPANQVTTATSTSTFYFSGSLTQTAFSATREIGSGVTSTNTCGFRFSNSSYPSVWADFTLPGVAFSPAGTAAVTAGTRSAFGPLQSTMIQSGSTMKVEAFNSGTASMGVTSGAAEVTGTSVSLTLGATAFTSTAQSTFAYPGTFTGVTTGSLTSTSSFTATTPVGPVYILLGPTLTNSIAITNVTATGNTFSDVKITAQNSAYPGAYAIWSPVNHGNAMGTGIDRTWAGIGGNVSNTLLNGIIQQGTTWTFIVSDNTDHTPTGADMDVSNLSFTFTGTTTILANSFDSGVLAGPFNAGGNVDSVDNAVITMAPVGTSFIMGTQVAFSGTATRVQTNSHASELRVRVRNSAFPSYYTLEFQPTPMDFSGGSVLVSDFQIATPSPRDVYTNRMNSTLRGMLIPAGSTFSAEFWDNVDNGAGADATWSNVQFRFISGTAWTTGGTAPSVFTDLGSITNANASTSNALSATSPAITSGGVSWFKLTVPSNVDGTGGSYLNLYVSSAATTGAVSDSTMSLYDNSGRLLGYDDDGGAALFSKLTFGAAGATTPYSINLLAGEEPFNGKDGGGLPAGTYWIAVVPYASNGTSADAFAVTSNNTSSFANGVKLNAISNLPAPRPANQEVTGTLNLGDTGTFGGGLVRYVNYSVWQNGAVVGGGMITAHGPSNAFSVTLPTSVTGAVTIEWDGSSFLDRKTNVNLTGSDQAIGAVNLQNGDVDNSGEVDAGDIDEVISNFGQLWPGGYGNIDADLDVSGEVDAADIDIIIANFGGLND